MNPSKAKVKAMVDSRQWNDIGIRCYEALYDCMTDANLFLKEKHKRYAHIQLCMGILNAESCDFVVYSKNDDECFVRTVTVDINYIRDMVSTLEPVFFQRILPEMTKKN